MMIEGKHTCNKCENEFEWYYIVPTHISRRITAHWIPKGKTGVEPISRNKDMTPIEVLAYCTHCDKRNIFKINYDEVKISN